MRPMLVLLMLLVQPVLVELMLVHLKLVLPMLLVQLVLVQLMLVHLMLVLPMRCWCS